MTTIKHPRELAAEAFEALADKAPAPFPLHTLPETLREFVRQTADAKKCDPSMVAGPLLAGLAGCIGTSTAVRLAPEWDECPPVWLAMVASSGLKKSPSFKAALKAVRSLNRRLREDHERAMADHARDLETWERESKAWEEAAEESEIDAGPEPVKPPEPRAPRLILDDVTIAVLGLILHENPRGGLLTIEELTSWFGAMNAFDRGSGDVGRWLSLSTMTEFSVDRKGGGGRKRESIHVPSAAVSIVGTIQASTLRRRASLANQENGLLARFLLICPPKTPRQFPSGKVDDRLKAAVAEVVERLFSLTMAKDADGRDTPAIVPLSPEAQEVWERAYMENAADIDAAEEGSAWEAALSKFEAYIGRLALIHHLCRWAAGDRAVPTPTTPMDAASIEAGAELVRWFKAQTKAFYATLDGGEARADTDRAALLRYVRGKGGDVEVGAISTYCRPFKNRAGAVHEVCEQLHREKAGEVYYKDRVRRFRLGAV